MQFGLVDNPRRPEFNEEDERHSPDFDFKEIKIGDRGIITFKNHGCLDENYMFSNFQVVVVEKSKWTITTKLDVTDLDSVKPITYHRTEIYNFKKI